MTEQELREKIVEALEQGGKNFHESFHEELKKAFENGAKHFGSKDCKKTIYDFYADALIEKGMIFVDERTVILPIRMSGKTLIQKAQYYDQMKHRAEVAERDMQAWKDCAQSWQRYFHEKELQEEGKMTDFVCKKCGSAVYEIKDKPNGTGIAHGLYCAKCGFWHKWLNKDELKKITTIKPQEKCYSIDEVNHLIAEEDKLIQKLKTENAELKDRLSKEKLKGNK